MKNVLLERMGVETEVGYRKKQLEIWKGYYRSSDPSQHGRNGAGYRWSSPANSFCGSRTGTHCLQRCGEVIMPDGEL